MEKEGRKERILSLHATGASYQRIAQEDRIIAENPIALSSSNGSPAKRGEAGNHYKDVKARAK